MGFQFRILGFVARMLLAFHQSDEYSLQQYTLSLRVPNALLIIIPHLSRVEKRMGMRNPPMPFDVHVSEPALAGGCPQPEFLTSPLGGMPAARLCRTPFETALVQNSYRRNEHRRKYSHYKHAPLKCKPGTSGRCPITGLFSLRPSFPIRRSAASPRSLPAPLSPASSGSFDKN